MLVDYPPQYFGRSKPGDSPRARENWSDFTNQLLYQPSYAVADCEGNVSPLN
jgi:hypothetical protein